MTWDETVLYQDTHTLVGSGPPCLVPPEFIVYPPLFFTTTPLVVNDTQRQVKIQVSVFIFKPETDSEEKVEE